VVYNPILQILVDVLRVLLEHSVQTEYVKTVGEHPILTSLDFAHVFLVPMVILVEVSVLSDRPLVLHVLLVLMLILNQILVLHVLLEQPVVTQRPLALLAHVVLKLLRVYAQPVP